MVSKRNFEQRSLDGLQIKAQAYSCKIGLIPGWKPHGFSIFQNRPPFLCMLPLTFLVPSRSHCACSFSMAASAATILTSNAGKGVLICVSKATDESDKSLLFVSKLEDNQIGEGNPVQLINPSAGMNLWENIDLRTKNLSFGEIVKFRIVENKYVYDGKTGRKKMVSYSKLPWKRLLLLNIII